MAWTPPEEDEIVVAAWTPPDEDEIVEAAPPINQLAQGAAAALAPVPTPKPAGLMDRLKAAFVPTEGGMVEQIKRMANPLAGRFGLSRFMQEAGQSVKGAAEASRANLESVTNPVVQSNPALATGVKAGYDVITKTAELAGVGLTPQDAQTAIATQGMGDLAGQGVAKVGTAALKKIIPRTASALSGIRPSSYVRLIDDPKAILPASLGGAGTKEAAGAAMEEVLTGAGVKKSIIPGGNYQQRVLELATKAIGDMPEAEITEQAIPQLVRKLSPTEQVEMLRSLRQVFKTAVEGKDNPTVRLRMLWKNALEDAVEEGAAGYGQTVDDYARAKLKEEFSSFLPLNKYGTPSIGRVAFGGGPVGAAVGGVAGPVAGAIAGAGAVSPRVHGLLTAGAAGALETAPLTGAIPMRQVIEMSKRQIDKTKKPKKK